jgi:hypothetical protein
MIARYNHATGEIFGGIDGQPPQSFGQIVFDGPTEVINFGVKVPGHTTDEYPFIGYIGEGILSATQETNNAWYAFWERVQGTMCDRPAGEYLYNHQFDCGVAGWTNNPQYNATLTDNGDGAIHLLANTNFGSVCPVVIPTESAEWILEVKVKNQTGTKGGKLSIQAPNNVWHTVPIGSAADGVYQNTYTGAIKRIDVGANNETNFEMDVEYYSLRKVTSNIVTYDGDTVMYGNEVVTHG